MKVKPLDQITAKWQQRAQNASQAYTDGVKSPRTSWAQATEAAANNWQQGVTQAATTGRFSAGVAAAGDSAWQNGAVNKGASRYGPGVAASTAKFSAGFGKFSQVLNNLTLPPRFPKGDPQNQARSSAVAVALRNAKLGK